jgi:hypothetical protein
MILLFIIIHYGHKAHFIHSPPYGNLGWFHNLAIVNSMEITWIKCINICWLWFLDVFTIQHTQCGPVAPFRSSYISSSGRWERQQVSSQGMKSKNSLPIGQHVGGTTASMHDMTQRAARRVWHQKQTLSTVGNPIVWPQNLLA